MKAQCVCVCRECREQQRNVTRYSPHPHPLPISTLGGSSLALPNVSRGSDAQSASHSHTHTHNALRLARSRREQQLAISLLFSRSVACKCGECNMQRASAVDPPASVSFPFPLALTPSSPSTNFLSVPLLCLPFGNCDAFALL